MKRIYTIFLAVLLSASVFAQSPQKMSYQAVIRNISDQLVKTSPVGMRISILKDATPVYAETQTPTTNSNGLVTIEIGVGTPVSGTFADIDWSNGTYFIKTETDPSGGTSYSITGTSQILSVPYALYSNNLNIRINSRPTDLFVKDDGSLWVIPKISVEKPYSLAPTVTDADGNTYGTVKIGTQVWMAENLKTIKYYDNTPIPLVTDNDIWAALATPAYCWQNNDISNKTVYGALYNWYTVNTGKLCPIGWHVPSHSEFEILTTYLGTLASDRLRETGTVHWQDRNDNAINDSKFSALPGGYRENGFSGFSGTLGQRCFIWSSTEENILYLNVGDEEVTFEYKYSGCSVRCLKN
jgi:uncharacterized protein (TIGR02145 family)